MGLLLEAVEQHNHIAPIEDEKHPVDVALPFRPQLIEAVLYVFDELRWYSFLCLQENEAVVYLLYNRLR